MKDTPKLETSYTYWTKRPKTIKPPSHPSFLRILDVNSIDCPDKISYVLSRQNASNLGNILMQYRGNPGSKNFICWTAGSYRGVQSIMSIWRSKVCCRSIKSGHEFKTAKIILIPLKVFSFWTLKNLIVMYSFSCSSHLWYIITASIQKKFVYTV